jgi:hypothetical protein
MKKRREMKKKMMMVQQLKFQTLVYCMPFHAFLHANSGLWEWCLHIVCVHWVNPKCARTHLHFGIVAACSRRMWVEEVANVSPWQNQKIVDWLGPAC